jgi:hypothetical protein
MKIHDVCAALTSSQERLQQLYKFGREVAAKRVPVTAADCAYLDAEVQTTQNRAACAQTFLLGFEASNDSEIAVA